MRVAPGKLRESLPWLGLVAYGVGCYAVVRVASRADWSVGGAAAALALLTAIAAVLGWKPLSRMFGPVFAYECLRLGRRRMTFMVRGLYVAVLAGLFALMYMSWYENLAYTERLRAVPAQKLAEFARLYFMSYALVQLFLVALITPSTIAGCIADEKERKTLEFLLATDLSSAEIVFGKGAARTLALVFYVLAGVPLVAFLQLFGGIDPELLIAVTAMTLILVLGLAAISLYASVQCRRPREAILMAFGIVFVYAVGSFLLWSVVAPFKLGAGRLFGSTTFLGVPINWPLILDWLDWGAGYLASGNPAYQIAVYLARVSRVGIVVGPASLTDALTEFAAFWAIVGGLLMTLAVVRLRRKSSAPVGTSRKLGRGRAVRAARSVKFDPMVWKEVTVERQRRHGVAWRLMMVIVYVLVFAAPAIITVGEFGDLIPVVQDYCWPNSAPWDKRWHDFHELMNVWVRISTGCLCFLLFVGVSIRGSGAISGERDRDTWISLIATPLSPWQMLRAKWLGTLLGVRSLLGLVMVVWAAGLVTGSYEPLSLIFMLVALLNFASGFAWIGLYCSARARKTLTASVQASLLGGIAAGGFWVVLSLCCFMPLSLAGGSGNLDSQEFFQLLAGVTPPLVMGTLPIPDWARPDLGAFGDSYRRTGDFGPAALVIGQIAWLALSGVLAAMTHHRFAELANRQEPVRNPTPGAAAQPPIGRSSASPET